MTTQIAYLDDSVPRYSTRVSENFAARLHAFGAALAGSLLTSAER